MMRARGTAVAWGLLLAGLATGTVVLAARALAATAPSIVLVSIDTARADRLGAYGARPSPTPFLDRLAAEGVVFENAATPVPVTLPAHASLFTGVAPNRHGVRDNGLHRLQDDLPTLAGLLRQAGYATGAVVAAGVLDRQYGLDRGFTLYDDDVSGGGQAIAERGAAAVTDAALAAAGRLRPPFFLFVHYFDPHAPYAPPPPFRERFRDRPYDGELAYVDAEIARLRAGLDQRGLARDAILCVTADHGESLGEHGEATHGVFLYQSTIRVPLLFVAPGRLPRGARVAAFARLTDVLPTLLDLVGRPAPAGIDGRSLRPLVQGKTAGGTDAPVLLLETNFGHNAYGFAPLRGLYDGRTKFIEAPRPELYDVASDPLEARNLYARRRGQADVLRRRWEALYVEDRIAHPPGETISEEAAERVSELSQLGYVAASRRGRHDPAAMPDPKDGIDTVAAINRVRAEMAAGRLAEAERILADILKTTPDNFSALMLRGFARIQAARYKDALAPLERAARLSPAHADVRYNLGLARAGSGDAAGAEREWRATLRIAPRYHDAAVNLIDLLQTSGRAREAADALAATRGAGIGGPLIDFLEGRAAAGRGDRDAARTSLRRALAGPLPPHVEAEARRLLGALGS